MQNKYLQETPKDKGIMYTIILKDKTAFVTQWYEYENNWNDDLMFMVIYGLQYSTDGKTWINFDIDHL